jgi:hypothetical protein
VARHFGLSVLVLWQTVGYGVIVPLVKHEDVALKLKVRVAVQGTQGD